jgi:hypothetical protein
MRASREPANMPSALLADAFSLWLHTHKGPHKHRELLIGLFFVPHIHAQSQVVFFQDQINALRISYHEFIRQHCDESANARVFLGIPGNSRKRTSKSEVIKDPGYSRISGRRIASICVDPSKQTSTNGVAESTPISNRGNKSRFCVIDGAAFWVRDRVRRVVENASTGTAEASVGTHGEDLSLRVVENRGRCVLETTSFSIAVPATSLTVGF